MLIKTQTKVPSIKSAAACGVERFFTMVILMHQPILMTNSCSIFFTATIGMEYKFWFPI